MPWLAELREKYASQGFEVLGIVTDGASGDKVKQIVAKYGVKYPILRCTHKTAQAYGGLPYLPKLVLRCPKWKDRTRGSRCQLQG
jgi:hypothetical protein